VRRTTGLAALVASAALLLTACGDDSDSGGSDTVTTDSGIEVEGEAGEKPSLTIPDSDPPTELVVEVLDEGDGTEVGADDFVVANYLGQTWDPLESAPDEANVFDNSYDRGAVTGFPLNGVVAGWKEGLTGQTVGSRVLLTIPPDKGYGETGSGDGSIPANATLAFVVEIVEAFPSDGVASGTPVAEPPAGLPAVTEGEEGAPPALDFAGATEPTETTSAVLIEGDGDAVGENVVVNMVQASYPDGADAQNTWELKQPQGIAVADMASFPGGLGDLVAGSTVGSRLVVAMSGADNADAEGNPGTPFVMLLDIVGTY
jgi:peptidylprolyl isomerase